MGLKRPESRFEDGVAELYRLLGFEIKRDQKFKIERDQKITEVPVDLLIEKKTGGISTRTIIECCEQPLSGDHLIDLVRRQKLIRLRFSKIDCLVVTAHLPDAETRESLESVGISCISYPELLREVVPLDAYIEKRIADHEQWRAKNWRGEDWFIRPDVTIGNRRDRYPAMEHIGAWLGGKRDNLLALLGDVGTGKTTLAGFLAYEMAKAHKADPLRHPAPVLIELKDVRKETSLDSIVITHFRNHLTPQEMNDFSFSRFDHLVRQGRIVLLFDAFDEMAERMRPDVIRQNLNELIKPSKQGGKVLLTCRTHYFNDLREQEGYVGEGAVYLQEFTNDQVISYLIKARPQTADEDWEKIQEIYNLKELVQRPLLLDMVVKGMPELRRVDASTLYAKYADIWFTREQKKGGILDKEVKLTLMKELAWQIWDEEKHEIHFYDLLRLVKRLRGGDRDFYGEDVYDVAEELRTASFLRRNNEGFYRFADPSFGEYFLACKIHEGLIRSEGLVKIKNLLRTKLLDRKVIFFLTLLMKQNSNYRSLRSILTGDYEASVSENALQILYWSGRIRCGMEDQVTNSKKLQRRLSARIPRGARLSNARLKGIVLEAADLSEADFRGADLTEANLNQSILRDADFRGATLAAAKMERVSAARGDFREAQLGRAVLRQSDLRNCNFTGAMHRDTFFEENDTSGAKGLNVRGDLQRSDLIPVVQQTLSSGIHSIAIGPTGEWYASGNQDGLISIHRIHDDRLLHLLDGHRKRVHSLHFSPSGALLVSGDLEGTVRLWSVSDGRMLHYIDAHKDCVRVVRFSPDGKFVASGSDDRSVRLWLVDEGKALRSFGGFEGHTDSVNAVHFSPDGKLLASAASDGTVRIWDVNSGYLLHVLREEEDSSAPRKFKINAVQFSPDGKLLASTDAHHRIRIWLVSEGEQKSLFKGHTDEILSLCFSPDGRLLASGGKDLRLRVWQAGSEEMQYLSINHSDWIDTVWFSAGGKQLIVGSTDRCLRLWAIDNGQLQPISVDQSDQTLRRGGAIKSVSLSPDGKMLAGGGDHRHVYVWSARDSRLHHALAGHKAAIRSVDFSPDGKLLASGGEDRSVRIWSADDGQILNELRGHDGQVTSVHFSPQGRLLVSGSEDKSLRLWLVRSGEQLNPIEGPQAAINSVRFSPDGASLAAACDDKIVWLWSAKDGHPPHLLRKFEGHTSGVSAVRFSPNGVWLASGGKDNTVRLWRVATGRQVRALDGHTERVVALAFSPDGSFLASGSLDGSVQVWSLEKGQMIRTLTGHLGEVHSLAITRNSKCLIAAGAGGRIQFWDLENGKPCLYRYGLGPEIWLDVLPDGRFYASNEGKRYLCYTEQGTLHSYPAETLLTDFYDPSAVKAVLERLVGAIA